MTREASSTGFISKRYARSERFGRSSPTGLVSGRGALECGATVPTQQPYVLPMASRGMDGEAPGVVSKGIRETPESGRSTEDDSFGVADSGHRETNTL